ncbi:pentatricopeptide repeat-containing protein 2, mitochondrial [Camelus ferus]|nr:pentatricopeptide repeat-containing protein 2, mitochondrial [Camelus ferus]
MGAAILEHTKRNAGPGPEGTGRGGVTGESTLRPPPLAPAVGAARDSMAAAFRPSKEVLLLQALRNLVYTGVGGSGCTCCRCPVGETYLRNLEEKLTQNKLILKEELRTLLHLCESRDDMELAKNVIYRYHAENRNITLGEYKFGPLFMRLCYELDLEESAVELIRDQVLSPDCSLPHLRGFFSDSTSFNILMDMLFIKGKYKSALEVLIEMENQDVKFSKDTYVLAFAICYKLNQLAKAVSIFSQIMKPESIICTNLNIMIHIESNMLKTLIEILTDATEGNLSRFVKKPVFSEEVLVKVREKVKDVPALLVNFDKLYRKLHMNGQVTTYTLDALLCHTPRDRRSHMVLLNKRTVSRRTFQPLSQSLWAE